MCVEWRGNCVPMRLDGVREGFRFTVLLRVASRASPSHDVPDMRLLVVEDDKKIASFVVNGLKQSGYAVDHSADGESALVLAENTPYDAAIVDLMLPKLDGLSLIQKLRAQGQRLPVLILSAKASVDDRVKWSWGHGHGVTH